MPSPRINWSSLAIQHGSVLRAGTEVFLARKQELLWTACGASFSVGIPMFGDYPLFTFVRTPRLVSGRALRELLGSVFPGQKVDDVFVRSVLCGGQHRPPFDGWGGAFGCSLREPSQFLRFERIVPDPWG